MHFMGSTNIILGTKLVKLPDPNTVLMNIKYLNQITFT
jgi:hypothetical protein